MEGSKLIALLQSIRSEEWRWLAKWVRSPYYNNNERVVDLFDHLRKYAPAFDAPKLDKEQVFAHLFPGQPYEDRRLRLIMFRLSELVEGFLVAQRLDRDQTAYQQLLQAELGARNQYDWFVRKNQELAEQLEQRPVRDEDYYLARWHQQSDLFFHPQTNRYGYNADQLGEMMHNLDAFFLLSKLYFSAELRNRQNILPEQHAIVLLDESLVLASENPVFSSDLVLQAYRDMYRLMESPEDETIFERLEEIAFHRLSLFRPDRQSALLQYLINTTIRFYNMGKEQYLGKQFRLYQLGLANDLLFEEGALPDDTFLNIVVTATMLEELHWTEAFLKRYTPCLPAEQQLDANNLGMAYWRFAKGDFSSCNDSLRQVGSNDLKYLLRVKSLSLRTYFELFLQDASYYDLVVYESQAFEKFLRRNGKMTNQRAQAYLNLASYLRKLTRLKANVQHTSDQLGELRTNLEKESAIIAKSWLMEKLVSWPSSNRP